MPAPGLAVRRALLLLAVLHRPRLGDGDGAGATGLRLERGERIAGRRRLVLEQLLEPSLGPARRVVVGVVILDGGERQHGFLVLLLVAVELAELEERVAGHVGVVEAVDQVEQPRLRRLLVACGVT